MKQDSHSLSIETAERTHQIATAAELGSPFDIAQYTVEEREDVLNIFGSVKNTGDFHWDENCRIAVRKFVDHNGSLIGGNEFRGTSLPKCIAPGGQAIFMLSIPKAKVPHGAESFELDLVYDGHFWLSERGGIPVSVPIVTTCAQDAVIAWLKILDDDKLPITSQAKQKLTLLREALFSCDFSTHRFISELTQILPSIQRREPHRLLAPTSTTVLRSLTQRNDSSSIDAFFQRFSQYFTSTEKSTMTKSDICVRFLSESRNHFRGGCPPIPASTSTWLNSRAFSRDVCKVSITNSMILAIGQDENLAIHPTDGGSSLFWWFAKTILIDRRLPSSLIPPELRDALCKSSKFTAQTDLFPQVSVFMDRLRDVDADYGARYDITTDLGRLAFTFHLLLESVDNEVLRDLVGPDVLAWMVEPIDDVLPLSPFEILAQAFAGEGPPCSLVELDLSNDKTLALRRIYDWLPQHSNLVEPNTIRIFGDYRSETGLSVNMRMTIDALADTKIAIECVDVQYEMLHHVTSGNPSGANGLTRPVDIFHLNLDDVPALVCRYSSACRADVYRIGFALWETSRMPEQHRPGLSLLDEIWVPTAYVADVYKREGFEQCHVVGKGIDLPEPQRFDLSALGIPDECFTFLVSFDINSWIERKNPIAAVNAFLLAFPSDKSVRLIIKTTGLRDHQSDRTGQIDRIFEAASRDDRIVLLNKNLPFTKYLGLIAAVDASVSPHRAEGFGYLPAYSMILGTATIVTDYSGTKDFCNLKTSFPVSANIVDLKPGDFIYDAPGAQWADIDVASLAETMRQVRDDRTEAESRTTAGAALLRQRYSQATLRKRYMTRLQSIMSA